MHAFATVTAMVSLPRCKLKVGLQCDAKSCAALVCDTQKVLIKNLTFFSNQTQECNAKEHEDRI